MILWSDCDDSNQSNQYSKGSHFDDDFNRDLPDYMLDGDIID